MIYNLSLSDFGANLTQEYFEILSLIKVLKNSTSNENYDLDLEDITTFLEVIFNKFEKTNKTLCEYIEKTEQ